MNHGKQPNHTLPSCPPLPLSLFGLRPKPQGLALVSSTEAAPDLKLKCLGRRCRGRGGCETGCSASKGIIYLGGCTPFSQVMIPGETASPPSRWVFRRAPEIHPLHNLPCLLSFRIWQQESRYLNSMGIAKLIAARVGAGTCVREHHGGLERAGPRPGRRRCCFKGRGHSMRWAAEGGGITPRHALQHVRLQRAGAPFHAILLSQLAFELEPSRADSYLSAGKTTQSTFQHPLPKTILSKAPAPRTLPGSSLSPLIRCTG